MGWAPSTASRHVKTIDKALCEKGRVFPIAAQNELLNVIGIPKSDWILFIVLFS